MVQERIVNGHCKVKWRCGEEIARARTKSQSVRLLIRTHLTPQVGGGATLARPRQSAPGKREANIGVPPVVLISAAGSYSPLICALTLCRIELACRTKRLRTVGIDSKR